jgi:hypothetical protein
MAALAEPWPPPASGPPRPERSRAAAEQPIDQRSQANECAQAKDGDAVEDVQAQEPA